MPNPGLDNLTPEPRYGSLVDSADVALQAAVAALQATDITLQSSVATLQSADTALQAADVALDTRLDTAEATLALLPAPGADAYCRVSSTADQVIATATVTNLTFGSEVEDTLGMHSTSVNTHQIVVPTGYGGIWLAAAVLVWDGSATGVRVANLLLNGSPVAGFGLQPPTASIRMTVATPPLRLVAGNILTVQVYQESGGNLSVIGATHTTTFTAGRVA